MIKKYEADEMNYRKSIKECFKGSKEELAEEMQNFNAEVSLKKKHLEKVSFPSFFLSIFFVIFFSLMQHLLIQCIAQNICCIKMVQKILSNKF